MNVGDSIGGYHVVAKLGEGGMGEVYRARDARLNRDVALKILPATLAADASRVSRFEREAQLLATLNHPGIGAIYGVEHADGTPVLVLELVEGVTLADRVASGPLAIDDALRVAQQIAVALEAAHEKGIVHRDLKPANIKVTDRGQVKVLDFGLAKMLEPDGDSTPLANSPTMSLRATQAGMILGTATYMSPEQARGRPIDRRTDVWSFGCVLFEMLTGRPPFDGATLSDIVAAILKQEPEWSALPPETPRAIERLLKRCLARDQAMRLRDMGDAHLEIADALEVLPADASYVVATRPLFIRRLAWPATALALMLLTFALTRAYFAASAHRAEVIETSIPFPARSAGANPATRFALSPDGRTLAVIGQAPGEPRLVWLRPLNSTMASPLKGSEGASIVFWSADGRFIAFFTEKELKRVEVSGGSAFTICPCPASPSTGSGSWSVDDVILFAQGSVIVQVPARGGVPSPVTGVDPNAPETRHRSPVFLPDGRHFMFVSYRGLQPQAIYAASLDSREPTLLVEAATNPQYAEGYLVFVKGNALMAQPFDADSRQFLGEARPLVGEVRTLPDGNHGFSVSARGNVLVRTGGVEFAGRRFEWRDRTGKRLQPLGEAAQYWDAHLSPDGRSLSVSVATESGLDREIWVLDTERGVRRPVTDDPASAFAQAWSPDGARLIYTSTRDGRFDLYERVLATGQETVVSRDGAQKFVHDWSSDGRYIIYSTTGVGGRTDLFVLPLVGDRKPTAYQSTRASEIYAQFSPDGRWVAFMSDESGMNEVYVAAFPGPTQRILISRGGGAQPRWSRDGKELFYLQSNQLIAVQFNVVGENITPVKSEPLFELGETWSGRWRYDVAPDGKRFLVGETDSEGPPLMAVTVNWTERLKN